MIFGWMDGNGGGHFEMRQRAIRAKFILTGANEASLAYTPKLNTTPTPDGEF